MHSAPAAPVRLLARSTPAQAQGTKIADETLKKVKHATVYLRVKMANGTDAQGTGWFVEPGLIVTNAHVLGLMGAASRLPRPPDIR